MLQPSALSGCWDVVTSEHNAEESIQSLWFGTFQVLNQSTLQHRYGRSSVSNTSSSTAFVSHPFNSDRTPPQIPAMNT